MSKKQLIISSILSAVFTLGLLSVLFYFTLQENRQLAHFYFTNTGGHATITLGSYRLGAAPIRDYTLPTGWYDLTIATDYYTYTLPLRLSSQTATVVDWQVSHSLDTSSGVIYELIPTGDDTHPLSIVTTPDRAAITIDHQSTSSTTPVYSPVELDTLSAGEHTINLNLPGHLALQVPVILTPGYKLKLTVKLAANQAIFQ